MTKIKQATKQGYIICEKGGLADLSYPNSKTRRGRVQGGGRVSPTLTTSGEVYQVMSKWKIRKLSSLEYWRLMGFSDEDYLKAKSVNSNTQLYKQSGNSICVSILERVFKELYQS